MGQRQASAPASHACINLRLPTSGGLWSWPFVKNGRELKVRPEGPLAFNSNPLIIHAALAGLGLAYLSEDQVRDHVAAGRLVRVLASWSSLVTVGPEHSGGWLR